MSQDTNRGDSNQNGAEPLYGPSAGARSRKPGQAQQTAFDGPAPAYTAPYPPYPSDVPYTLPVPVNIAAGLAYLVAPAVVFLLLPAYRSHALLRFHSWQSIFYFLAIVAVRVVEQLLVSMVPSAIAFSISSLVLLLLFAGWAVAVIKALQGEKWLMPGVGVYAERTASTTSSR
ncbi:MAG: DUF4870 domain-containing protein [Janthinobacterium lividum]